MPETKTSGDSRRKVPRRVTDVDPKFKPSHAPLLGDRLPYPTRISDVRYVEEDFDRDSVVGSVERSELFSEPAEAGRELTSGAEGASAEVLNGGNGVDKVDVCVLKDLIEAMKMQSVQQMVAQREFEADRIKREDERLRRLEEERFARESDRLRQIEEEKYRRDAERDVKRKKEVRRSELLKGCMCTKRVLVCAGFCSNLSVLWVCVALMRTNGFVISFLTCQINCMLDWLIVGVVMTMVRQGKCC